MAPIPPHRIFLLNNHGGAAALSFDELMAQLGQADVVICGEYHDDPATHKMELALFKGYVASHPVSYPLGLHLDLPVLSMEMFERDVQPVLTSYVFSRTVDEKEFLAKSRPWGNYATDYRPLIEYCKESVLYVQAANAPTSLTRRVGHDGWAAVSSALTDEERSWLAKDTTAPDDDYWRQFKSFMSGSGGSSHGADMTEEQIHHFYEAQCLKDDTMAESIIESMSHLGVEMTGQSLPVTGATNKHTPIFQLNGSFHSDYGFGVAQRVRQRAPSLRVYTIAIRPVPDFTPKAAGGSLDPQGEALADGTPVADFVIFVPAPKPTTTKPQ